LVCTSRDIGIDARLLVEVKSIDNSSSSSSTSTMTTFNGNSRNKLVVHSSSSDISKKIIGIKMK
jgi:hypothetical protein